MDFSLLYTSRRPKQIWQCVKEWISHTALKDRIEFVFVADEDDRPTAQAMAATCSRLAAMGIRAIGPIPSPKPGNCVKGWNTAAKHATGKVLIAISDDFLPPLVWDESMRMLGGDLDGDAAILVSDGNTKPGDLCMTLPIVTRAYYERVGYLLHPAYQSMFCDNDLAEHAAQTGNLIDARHIAFRHQHYVNAQRQKDKVDEAHASKIRFEHGRRIFEARKSCRFAIDEGPKSDMPGSVPDKWIAYVQTTGDDFCLMEACEELIRQGLKTFFFCVPSHKWNGEPVEFDIQGVTRRLEGMGAKSFIQHPVVKDYAYHGAKLAIDIETRVRNGALEAIERLGFGHVVIMDSDELWRRGLLDSLKALVIEQNPACVSVRSVPVIGERGLPIEGALDKVGIYIRANNRFLFCRGAYRNSGHELPGTPIFHFTATRRSRDAIIAKMKSSGHYDDPDYGFHHWINHKLPVISPGMRDAHMYRKGQNIWPLVREWTAEELNEIPASLHQYLWTSS